jgi:hypothetical protein
MERATQRWLIILGAILAIYVLLVLGHTLLGIQILPF